MMDFEWEKGRALTESEWSGGTLVHRMVTFLYGRASDRKLRLFACACCRPILDRVTNPDARAAVEAAEAFADGTDSAGALNRLHHRLRRFVRRGHAGTPEDRQWNYQYGCSETCTQSAFVAASSAWSLARGPESEWERSGSDQPDVLRDIFGNPFRSVVADSGWRTTDVVGVANAIHDDRAYDRLPILADALIDAGCDNDDILDHCRGPGPHVRGCWVVDLLTGRP